MAKTPLKCAKKIFSSFSIAALAAVFAIASSVFAATNWSTWTVDMTKTPGDALTSSSWNKMVAAIEETKTLADTAATNAAAAQASVASAVTLTAPVTLAKGATLPTDKKSCYQRYLYNNGTYQDVFPLVYLRAGATWYIADLGTSTTICNPDSALGVCYCY